MFVELEGRGLGDDDGVAGSGGDGVASICPEAMLLLAADVLGAVLSQPCVDDVPEDELCQVRGELCCWICCTAVGARSMPDPCQINVRFASGAIHNPEYNCLFSH